MSEKTTCPHCGHTWEPRVPDPKYCPMCKRPLKEVSSRKQVTMDKEVKQTQEKLVICNECDDLAIREVPDGRALCKKHYIEFMQTVRQPTSEEILQTA